MQRALGLRLVARAPRLSRAESAAASKPAASTSKAAPAASASKSSDTKTKTAAAAASESGGDGNTPTPTGFQEGGGDIAFKPTENGWGYSPTYANNYDRIFGNAAPEPAADVPEPLAAPEPCEKLRALEAAHEVGALSDELFARARRELEN